MSYINPIYNSTTRMSGLSGLDVEGIVTSLMQIESAKVDKVSQDRQRLIWKQEAYREITSMLQSLNNEYFNSLKPSTDMRNATVYNAFALKYDGLDTSSYFSAVAGTGARVGEYTIKNIVTAQAAKITGQAVTGSITGKVLTGEEISKISSADDSNRFMVDFNGVKKEILLDDGLTNINELVDNLQAKLDAAFGENKITVSADEGKLTFTTSNTNTLSFSSVQNGGNSAIFGADLSKGITLTPRNNRFMITLGTQSKEVELPAGEYADADAVASALQSLVDDEEFGFGPDKITVTVENNRILMKSVDTEVSVSVSAVESRGLSAIGLTSAAASNKMNLDAKIYDLRDSFGIPLTVSEEDKDISFSINGQTFSFNSSTTTLRDIMNEVNGSSAGVKMSYDSLNDRFILESKQTGVTSKITSSDISGGLLGSLSLVGTDVAGRDASITYDDGSGEGEQVITRSTNSVNVNGITFNLKKDYSGPVNVEVSSDPSKAVELIKGFVTKYNEVLDKINAKLSEKRDYDFEPLTDSQKAAMTEEEIKQWEEKAKAGILANDGLLRDIVSGLRNAVMQAVDGNGLLLSSIGIKSASWLDKGKLYIDEDKLTKVLTENPDQVFDLFTKQSNVLYSTAATDSSARSERFNESGLIQRISDVIQDNIRTNTYRERRGALLEKAGITGDRSQFNNLLYNQISDYDRRIDRLNDALFAKENSYYLQFAQLEALINNMNTQSAWLAQQFAY